MLLFLSLVSLAYCAATAGPANAADHAITVAQQGAHLTERHPAAELRQVPPLFRSLLVELSRLLFEAFRDSLVIGLGLSSLDHVDDGDIVLFHLHRHRLLLGGHAERS